MISETIGMQMISKLIAETIRTHTIKATTTGIKNIIHTTNTMIAGIPGINATNIMTGGIRGTYTIEVTTISITDQMTTG